MKLYPFGATLFAWAFNRHCGWVDRCARQDPERIHNAEYEACPDWICRVCWLLEKLTWNSEEATR